MTTITLITIINAPKQLVFDACRNIDLHQKSTSKTKELAIAGITSGLINLNETVTWKGKHFGLYLTHKSRITEMNLYSNFRDEMVEGKFKSFQHDHFFEEINGSTTMKDEIQYEVPLSILGKVFDSFILKKHLTKLITERNQFIKNLVENNSKTSFDMEKDLYKKNKKRHFQ